MKEYKSNIATIRDLEDCIRTTKKYTKGAFSKKTEHPIQGSDFPSRVLTEYYEVYPTLAITWGMPAGIAIDWLWGEYNHIDVFFRYDYRANKASMTIHGGTESIRDLKAGIPGLQRLLEELETIEYTSREPGAIKTVAVTAIRSADKTS
jgi:hypothetical protein